MTLQQYDKDGRLLPLTDDDAMLAPIGLSIANLTDVTSNVNNRAYFLYLGRVTRAITTSTFVCRVTTAYVAGVAGAQAEVGVFTGEVVVNGAASLSRVGFTDVSGTFNTTGIKTTTISLSGVLIGDALWLAYGSGSSVGGTRFQLRAMLADDIQSGVFQVFIGRISTMAVPATTTLETETRKPAWARLST